MPTAKGRRAASPIISLPSAGPVRPSILKVTYGPEVNDVIRVVAESLDCVCTERLFDHFGHPRKTYSDSSVSIFRDRVNSGFATSPRVLRKIKVQE